VRNINEIERAGHREINIKVIDVGCVLAVAAAYRRRPYSVILVN